MLSDMNLQVRRVNANGDSIYDDSSDRGST